MLKRRIGSEKPEAGATPPNCASSGEPSSSIARNSASPACVSERGWKVKPVFGASASRAAMIARAVSSNCRALNSVRVAAAKDSASLALLLGCADTPTRSPQADELLEIRTEQPRDIALDIGARHRPAILCQNSVGVGEDWGERPPGVSPFVDYLLEHPRIGVLRDKAGTQHFQALARDLLDNRRIVQEPPASERHQVIEFPGIDA